jgi:putative endonuclease
MYAVYILASGRHGTLYVGVTNDLARRIWEHRSKSVDGFTKRYDVRRLVYYEMFDTLASAQDRERRLKRWRRDWKVALIEKVNPDWGDLYATLEP